MSALASSLRVLLFGTRGSFSLTALAELLAAGVKPAGVVVPAEDAAPPIALLKPDRPHSPIPLVEPFVERSAVELAWTHSIPVFAVARLGHPDTHALLASL